MDTFGIPDRLCEMDEACNFQDLPDDDVFNAPRQEDYDCLAPDWLDSFTVLGQDDPVLNDRMMSEAARSPRVHSEHSYSMSGGTSSAVPSLDDAVAAGEESQVSVGTPDLPICQPASSESPLVAIKTEPVVFEARRASQPLSLLRPQQPTAATAAMVVLTAAAAAAQQMQQQRKQPRSAAAALLTKPAEAGCQQLTRVSIKLEPAACTLAGPGSPLNSTCESMDEFSDSLPPTPPSSAASGDSDGGCSSLRQRGASSRSPSPIVEVVHLGGGSMQHKAGGGSSRSAQGSAAAPYSQPIPTSGALMLTEEEKRTLVSEGYAVPTRLPLTKQEERNLKKVRRKIKNKISAQESRRKKKEYVDTLERRVEDLSRDNGDLRRKCDSFQSSNRSLLEQLQKLQALVKGALPSSLRSPSASQAGTCLAVLFMCFAVFIGGWSPSNTSFAPAGVFTPGDHWSHQLAGPDAYSTPSMKSSRTLMHIADDYTSDGDDIVGSSRLLPFCWNSFAKIVSKVGWHAADVGKQRQCSSGSDIATATAASAATASRMVELSQEPHGSISSSSGFEFGKVDVIVSPVISAGQLSLGEATTKNITN